MNIVDIGTTAPEMIEIGSHNWGETMNRNLIKASFLINSGVNDYLTEMPGDVPEGSGVIVDPHIYFTTKGTTYKVMPLRGVVCYVTGQQMFYVYDGNQWIRFDALNLSPPAQTVGIRSLNINVTGRYSKGDTIYSYTPDQDITVGRVGRGPSGGYVSSGYAALRTYRNTNPVTSPIENPGFTFTPGGGELTPIPMQTSPGPTHYVDIPATLIKSGQTFSIQVNNDTSETFIADISIPYKVKRLMSWHVIDKWEIKRAYNDIEREDSSFEVRNRLRAGWNQANGGQQLWGEDVLNHFRYQVHLAGLGVDYAEKPFPNNPADLRFIDLYEQISPPNQICQAVGSEAVVITEPHNALKAYSFRDNNMYFYDGRLQRWVQLIPRKDDVWKKVKQIEIWVNVPYWPAASKSYIRVLFDGELWQGRNPVVKHMQGFYQSGLPGWSSTTVPQLHLSSTSGVFADIVYENNAWILKRLNSTETYPLSGGVFAINYAGNPSRPDMTNFVFSITLDVIDVRQTSTLPSNMDSVVQPFADVVNDPLKFTSGINYIY